MGNKPRIGDIYRKGVEDTLVLLTKEAAEEMGIQIKGLDNDHVLGYTVFHSNYIPKENTGTIELLNGELKGPDTKRYEARFASERADRLKDYLREVLQHKPAPEKLYSKELRGNEENIEAKIMPLINDTYKKTA